MSADYREPRLKEKYRVLLDEFLVTIVTDCVSGIVVDPGVITLYHKVNRAKLVDDFTLSQCQVILFECDPCYLLDRN